MLTTQKRVAGALLPAFAAALLLWGTGCKPAGVRALEQGERLRKQGQPAAAIEPLTLAASLFRTNAQVWNRLGLANHAAGQATNAFKAYHQALILARGRDAATVSEVRYNLGCLHLQLGNPSAAEAEFAACTLLQPKMVEAWARLASTQLRLRRLEAAERSFAQALALDRRHPEALNGVGVLLQLKRRPRDAYGYFVASLQARPDYAPALLNLALVAHHHLSLRSLALQKYREYLALSPRPANWAAVDAVASQLQSELKPPPIAVAPPPPVVPTNMAAVPRVSPTNEVPIVAVQPTNILPVVSVPPTNKVPVVSTPPTNQVTVAAVPPTNKVPTASVPATDSGPSRTGITTPPARTNPPVVAVAPPVVVAPVRLPTFQPTNVTLAVVLPSPVTSRPAPPPTNQVAVAPPVVRPKPAPEPPPLPLEEVKLPAQPEPQVGVALPPVEFIPPPPEPEPEPSVTPAAPTATPIAAATAPTVPAPSTNAAVTETVSAPPESAPPEPTRPVEQPAPERPAPVVALPPPEPEKKPSLVARLNPIRWFGGGKSEDSRRTRATIPLPDGTSPPPVPVQPAPAPVSTPPKPVVTAPPRPAAPAPVPRVVPRYRRLAPARPEIGDRSQAETFFNAALDAHRKSRWSDAVAGYARAVAADPAFYEAQHNLALAALNAGDVSRALVASENALALQDKPEARYQFALVLQRAGFPLDAADELDKVLKVRSNDASAHFLLANLYAQDMDESAKARTHYLKVLELEPRHPQAVSIRYWLATHP